MATMKSYSSEWHGLGPFIREVGNLYRAHSRDIPQRVLSSIEDIRRVQRNVTEHFCIDVRDADVLEIGPGQFLTQLTYLGTLNRAVGIDVDVIVQGFEPLGYARMLRTNGLVRTGKTIGRKMLGVDRKYASELRRVLGLKRLPHVPVYQMDVCKMSFPTSSFDFVYSRSVLHSLRDPGCAMSEIVRILRPGGVAYLTLHLYTSETGCLDPRVYSDRRQEVGLWPHLRPQLQGTFDPPNTFLNKLRLNDWRRLFAAKMPGAECILVRSQTPGLEDAAKSLQSQGELLDYSIDELLTGQFAAIWQKPPVPEKMVEISPTSERLNRVRV